MKKSPVNISGISESRVAPVAAYIKKEKGGQTAGSGLKRGAIKKLREICR